MSFLSMPLDILKMVKKLEENPELDEAVARGIVTAVTESHKAMVIATNQGLDELEKRVATKSDIADLKGQIGDLKGDMFKFICMLGFVILGAMVALTMVVLRFLPPSA
ncbi:MAG: hypothetical protein OXG56_11750 [Gammaproteobacteria bacterium]|nr:hypothetical protein [Gammaproteobacteria bacterium]